MIKEVPLCLPDITAAEENAVLEVLRSNWLAHGPKNKEFETMFAEYIGVKRALSLNSCTSALFLTILALGITGEVILPSFTFVATANAVLAAGAKPVFADINFETLNMNPEAVTAKIGPQTEAILVVHFGGQACDMDAFTSLAKRRGLALIEDSAETIGGEYHGRKTGSFGTGCFSFFPTKNMTTGEGGMVTTNDQALADRIFALIGHGIKTTTLDRQAGLQPWRRSAAYVGYNFRLTNFQAALGVEQLRRLDRMNEARTRHAEYLSARLAQKAPGLELPVTRPGRKHVWQMYTVKLGANKDRDKFVLALREKGVAASVHFDPPVHRQAYYMANGYGQTGLPVTEEAARRIVTLPMYPALTKADLDFIADTVAGLL